MKKTAIAVVLVLCLSGCSVGMAMHGKESPDTGAIAVGKSRGEVELQLGQPIKSVTNADGTRNDIYQYEVGNEPSPGRAAGHAVMDLLTLGVWEVVGTPVEAVNGDKYEMTVLYDKDDKVLSLKSKKI